MNVLKWYCYIFFALMLSSQVHASSDIKTSSTFNKTLIFSGDYWCPYNCTPNSDYEGYMVDILKAILTPKGYNVEYQLTNWSRALKNVRSGKHHAVIGALANDAPDFIYHKKSIGTSTTGIWSKNDNQLLYNQTSDLNNLRVGAIQGYSYGVELDQYLQLQAKDNIDYLSGVDPLLRNIKRLAKGRIDVVLEDKFVMTYSLKNFYDAAQLTLIGHTSPENVYVAFSPTFEQSPYLCDLIDTGIELLRTSGELDKILQRYGLADWQQDTLFSNSETLSAKTTKTTR